MELDETWSRAAAAEFADRLTDTRNTFDTGRIHDLVVRTIGGWILGGTFGPGAALPREEEMATLFSVSRSTIREANKVLSAKGLIELKPRVGVRVREKRRWRLLDAEVLSWFPTEHKLFESLLEARRIVEPEAAALAAQRGSASDLAAIEAAYDWMKSSLTATAEVWCEADLAFHRAVVSASHNIVLQALGDTLEAAFRSAVVATERLRQGDTNVLEVHFDVMERIRFRDAPGAKAAMNRLLDTAANDLKTALPEADVDKLFRVNS
jgi:GntR family transcriptional regulator, galactonate operon transcriptional repressor